MLNSTRWFGGLGVALLTTGLVGLLAGCGSGSPGSIELECGEGGSGQLTSGGLFDIPEGAALDLAGAALAADAYATLPSSDVSIECAADIVPTGYVALGPAVAFGPAGSWSDRPFDFTLPYKAARLPDGAGAKHVRIVAMRHIGDGTAFFPPVSNRLIDDEDAYKSRISFRGGELATYQIVARENAGAPTMRRYTYRAIVGISMGGNAALSIGLRNHERFDLIGNLVGEPGPSMKYTMTFMREYLFGGFCTMADQMNGNGNVGELCLAQQRPAMADQFEIRADFEHLLYQEGEGVGLTLNRDLYMKASRDLSRALGNPALYNINNSYVPPGVPASYIEQAAATRCANPIILDDFYDREFNPDGSWPVITFCDGNDSTVKGLGVFDPDIAPDNPAEIFLAVDVNSNGVRDSGEPLIMNPHEPYEDIGVDGLADADETGVLGAYDAATNPDPAGDNYHYLRNPLGTQGNFNWEEGEPWEDVGLDGIASTCQQGDTPNGVAGCYDFGEGDGVWTESPNVTRWFESDNSVMYAAMTAAERSRINVWADAGIRDFLNAVISANVGVATVISTYELEGAVWDSFEAVQGIERGGRFDFARIDWTRIPANNYMRYGDPNASETRILQGDGRHVGTALQIINRVTTAFAWLNAQWPNGDHISIQKGGDIIEDLSFIPPTSGRETPYALFLPPGYGEPENVDRTYPVVYFLHGYGQDPNDLVLLSAVFENYMTNPDWEPEDRFQKFIIVYVDGRCRPNMNGVPVPTDGDGCERGTFYMNAPLNTPAQMETNMLELMDFIDANYRTKDPEMVEIVQ